MLWLKEVYLIKETVDILGKTLDEQIGTTLEAQETAHNRSVVFSYEDYKFYNDKIIKNGYVCFLLFWPADYKFH